MYIHHNSRYLQKIFAFIGSLLFSSLCFSAELATYIKTTQSNSEYKNALLTLIFEQTKTEFGEYTLEYSNDDITAKRILTSMNESEQLNIIFRTPNNTINSLSLIEIADDIYKNLLGYRMCLATNTSIDFTKITDLTSLRSLRIGQGLAWPSIAIYQHNKIPVIEQPNTHNEIHSLFNMLAANRYDCLALSIFEIQDKYKRYKPAFQTLSIIDNFIIYYQTPTYFYVSKKHPEIAKRIEFGLAKIRKNGEYEKLFFHYVKNDYDKLSLKDKKIICLISPNLALDKQCKDVR